MSDENKNLEKDTLFTDEEILDHDYDGIREMNNGMPFWLTWLFLGSVMFGVIYFLHYMTNSGPTQREEYVAALSAHKEKMAEQNANVSEEELFASLDSEDGINTGKAVYETRCASCHGKLGEGGIGPNLVDKYWLHGDGKVKSVAKVIDEGVTEKGMPAWGAIMGKKDVIATAYYIVKIQGTNPPNQKAPQGNEVK